MLRTLFLEYLKGFAICTGNKTEGEMDVVCVELKKTEIKI
jgi:hypothetical protein